ncbi:hypothetical protein C8Q79DRAFT_666528 [Trametes meyenii]|nr:hypothetical protein C8Q79DRAFT_666528 [Trametes meyenii]
MDREHWVLSVVTELAGHFIRIIQAAPTKSKGRRRPTSWQMRAISPFFGLPGLTQWRWQLKATVMLLPYVYLDFFASRRTAAPASSLLSSGLGAMRNPRSSKCSGHICQPAVIPAHSGPPLLHSQPLTLLRSHISKDQHTRSCSCHLSRALRSHGEAGAGSSPADSASNSNWRRRLSRLDAHTECHSGVGWTFLFRKLFVQEVHRRPNILTKLEGGGRLPDDPRVATSMVAATSGDTTLTVV